MKWGLWSKSWNFIYEGLTNRISKIALDREERFDLIHTIVEVFFLEVRNAIVWFSVIRTRGHFIVFRVFWSMFLWCEKSWAMVAVSKCEMKAIVWCYSDGLKRLVAREIRLKHIQITLCFPYFWALKSNASMLFIGIWVVSIGTDLQHHRRARSTIPWWSLYDNPKPRSKT